MARKGAGRGHIYLRGTVWYAKVDYPPKPETPDKRNPKNIRLVGAASRKDAERELTRVLREIDTGAAVESSRLTLAAYLDIWLERDAAGRVRATTLEAYRRLIANHIAPGLGGKRLDALRPADIAAFYRALPGPATAHKCRAVLSGSLRVAARWGWIAANPARDAPPPTYRAARGAAWTKEEATAFVAACAASRYADLYRVELGTGLRIGELLDLRWADVAWQDDALTVRHNATWADGVYISALPKSGRERVVTLGPETVAALRRQRARVAAERLQAGQWTDEDRVFPTRRGTVMRPTTVQSAYRADVGKAGARYIRFHDLRHTHATLLIEAGVPLTSVSARLGHANIGVTANVYAHVTARMAREAATVIDGLLAV